MQKRLSCLLPAASDECGSGLTDMHLHLNTAVTPSRLLRAAALQGVTHVCTMAAQLDDMPELFVLKQNFARQISVFVGCHPQYAATFDETRFNTYLRSPFVRGIGECGLDKRPAVLAVAPLEVQLAVLQGQLQAAYALDLPLSVHCVKAHAELLRLLRPFKGQLRLCLHGANLSAPLIEEYLKLNAYLSIGSLAFRPDCALLQCLRTADAHVRARI